MRRGISGATKWNPAARMCLGLMLTCLGWGASGPEAVNLLEGIRSRKVSAEFKGEGVNAVRATLRARGGALNVAIPAGTRFAGAAGLQNMMAARLVRVRLPGRSPVSVVVPVVCVNMTRDVPAGRDRLNAQAPAPAGLRTILAAAQRARAPFAVTQAAVWIHTDNANFQQMGALRFAWGGRAIRELEAARAMMLLEQAGADLTRRAIWGERPRIAAVVLKTPRETPSEVLRWCARVVAGAGLEAPRPPASGAAPTAPPAAGSSYHLPPAARSY